MLIGEVAQSLEHVLQNLNKLNRALEEVVAVGNEFSPVEALWSHFEGVMAKRDGDEEKESGAEKSAGDDGEEGEEGEGRGEE